MTVGTVGCDLFNVAGLGWAADDVDIGWRGVLTVAPVDLCHLHRIEEGWHDLFDADDGDMNWWCRGAETHVAFVFDDGDLAGVGSDGVGHR